MEGRFRLIIIGFVLLFTGAILPFLMVNGLLRPTFFLIFLAYSCSTAGFITGFIGAARHSRPKK
jgi:hypothetical protein